MPSPAFIVEGQTEQRFVQRICPSAKVVMLLCNGKTVSAEAIAQRLVLAFKIMNNKYFPIVVLFDREGREEPREAIIAQVKTALVSHGVDPAQFRIGVTDRKIEAWMLYSVDEGGGADPTCSSCEEDEFEGTHAEGELTRRLNKVGVRYHKTTVGVQLLADLNATALSSKSASFRAFKDLLDFSCFWLVRPLSNHP
jgi:hypothetical protein